MKRSFCISVVFAMAACACSDDATAPRSDPDPEPDTVSPQIVAWLKANGQPFATAEPNTALDDLQFLKEMIGDARVVALGEATHGTREFFQMKHRTLEFLVKEMGFNTFAMEAMWAESNRINDYVHTGEGDPEVLLSGLLMWPWNTQEVLDMILWMREHNRDPGPDPIVSFRGLDMQLPGMPIHNVIKYLNTVDPDAAEEASALYACMLPFANGPDGFGGNRDLYKHQSESYREACRNDLQALVNSLVAHREEYESASSVEEFELAEQSARVVLQYEDWQSVGESTLRDFYMAQNAIWLLDHAGPDGKIVLWAHNGHVAEFPATDGAEMNEVWGLGPMGSGWERVLSAENGQFPRDNGQISRAPGEVQGSMGRHLRHYYGADLVIVGFDFYQGGFRAVTMNEMGVFTGLDNHSVRAPPFDSYEKYFNLGGMDRMVLDVRNVDLGTPATAWLAGPRRMRSIGAAFAPGSSSQGFTQVSIPASYDMIIYFFDVSAAWALPFNYPTGWD